MQASEQSAGRRIPPQSPPVSGSGRTVAELIDAYMLAYTGRDTARRHRLTFWCDRLGALPVAELTDQHVFDALEVLAAQPPRYWAGTDADGRPIMKAKRGARRTGATLNRYTTALGAVCTWAQRRRLVPREWEHPCKRIEKHPESSGVVRFLSQPERERLLAACRAARWPKLYGLVLLALTTGARRGELERLRWADVDFDRAVAHVPQTKNGSPRVLPLVPAVVAELQRLRGGLREHSTRLVFASERRPDQAYTFDSAWQTALRAADVKHFRFHDLRHTCASYLAQEGASLLEIGEVLGHRQVSVTKRYSHLTVNHKAALVGRILGGIQ